MRHDTKAVLTKCTRCGVLKSSKSQYCKPCSDEVREEYQHSYNKIRR